VIRALLLTLVAITCGLGGMYIVRAALVDVGGFSIGSRSAPRQLRRLLGEWRFWAGLSLIGVVLLVSLDLYSNNDLSKVVPLYSLSYVVVALVGRVYLREQVTWERWLGILLIVAGVVVLVES
jgi:drug/metabolite transporter (DMT)-like permease